MFERGRSWGRRVFAIRGPIDVPGPVDLCERRERANGGGGIVLS